MLTQEQLDENIRKAKGHRAVEEMIRDSRLFQLYLLSDGAVIRINKETGVVEQQTSKTTWMVL